MAYENKGPAPDGANFYNVEQAVGATGVNAPGDVKLVQYMLRHIYGSEASALAVDGYIGPVTINWIRRFQKDSKAAGINVLTDARIDRAFAEISTVSKTVYTVLALNRALRQKDPAAYANLPSAVPLSKVPRANPYNPVKNPSYPVARQVVRYSRRYTAQGWEITNTYSDGTTEIVYVKGLLFEDGKLYHGRIIDSHVFFNLKNDPILWMITFEDGYQESMPLHVKHEDSDA